jgi:hypothetical protein
MALTKALACSRALFSYSTPWSERKAQLPRRVLEKYNKWEMKNRYLALNGA